MSLCDIARKRNHWDDCDSQSCGDDLDSNLGNESGRGSLTRRENGNSSEDSKAWVSALLILRAKRAGLHSDIGETSGSQEARRNVLMLSLLSETDWVTIMVSGQGQYLGHRRKCVRTGAP